MKLLSLYGDFGRLNHETLEFHDGLNILELPNEGGKSTWCALLRAMLYGIDSKERDKAGFLADKNRYAPWSGAPMAGVMECEHEGRRLRIRRGADKRQPFVLLDVEDMDTGLTVEELMTPQLGEILTGVSREVFERTCFIPQGQMTVSPNGGLERRIAGLVQGGEEDASFSAAMTRLKDWRNRRGRSGTGLIPKLEARRSEVQRLLREQMGLLTELEQKRSELAACITSVEELEQEERRHQRLAARQIYAQAAEAKVAWEQAEETRQALEQAPRSGEESIDPLFDGMSALEAQKAAQADVQRLEELNDEAAQSANRRKTSMALSGVLYIVAILFVIWAILRANMVFGISAAALIACSSVILLAGRKKSAQDDGGEEILRRYDATDSRDILYRVSAYCDELIRQTERQAMQAERRNSAEETASRLKTAYEMLAAQAGESVLSENTTVTQPIRSAADTAAMLRMAKSRQEQLGREVSRAEGQLAVLGDPAALTAEEEGLTAQIRQRKEELAAITLAEEQLSAANDDMRERFSPAINQLAGVYFSKLTGQNWEELRLSPEFTAQVSQPGEPLFRQELFLSAGTLDQLYLAVRLAICELTYGAGERPPLVLDDALVQFDDRRLSLALETLKTMGCQVLLFTCQSREAASV